MLILRYVTSPNAQTVKQEHATVRLGEDSHFCS